ncbi:MAG: PEPxxWA-CTERM sorting domain-containing protein [Rhizomicrobium sp.]
MHKKLKLVVASIALLSSVAWVQSASASSVFSDNFNSYSGQLNWAPPGNWTAPGPGTVDLIGETTSGTSFDFYPGNGGYVDLDGSNGQPGTLQTLQTFAAGKYTLTFDLGGNARGDGSKTTDFSLGSFSDSIILASGDALGFHSYTFTTSGGQLVFSDLAGGNQNIGNILDNVSLASAVPEPSTWVMFLFGFGAIGWMLRDGRRRQSIQRA